MKLTAAIVCFAVCAASVHAAPSRRQAQESFDYIVVGAGAGGGVVASRLAQAGKKVLLMDAGLDYESANTTVPAFHARSNEDPNIDWAFEIDQGLPGRDKVWYPRASGLGGCTIHNAQVALKAQPTDWEEIATLMQDPSWSSSKMDSYFKKVEKCLYDPITPAHGHNGWLETSYVDTKLLLAPPSGGLDSNLINAFLGVTTSGLPSPFTDVNGPGGNMQEGWHLVPSSIGANKQRSSVRDLIKQTQAKFPNNLIIKTESLVTKIIMDGTTAKGVEFVQGRHLYKVSPLFTGQPLPTPQQAFAKEVIVSAGAFNTPQLLMLSGIGDPTELAKFGINATVTAKGVGKNLQEHFENAVNVQMKADFKLFEGCKFEANPDTDPCYKAYIEQKNNVYTSSGGLAGAVFRSKADLKTPDMYILHAPLLFHGYIHGYPQEVADVRNIWTFLVLKAHSSTQGTVTLRSTSPQDPPNIDFGFFPSTNTDLADMREGVKLVREKYIKNVLFQQAVEKEFIPGADVSSDAAIEDHLKKTSWGHHACCTAKMGPAGDPMAVLDSNFKVRGAQNLRVVDASIFPNVPGFFVAMPIYMAAEKAADAILQGL